MLFVVASYATHDCKGDVVMYTMVWYIRVSSKHVTYLYRHEPQKGSSEMYESIEHHLVAQLYKLDQLNSGLNMERA